MRKTLKICLIVTGITSVLFGISTFHLYRANESLKSDLRECASEVQEGCPRVSDYAIALERENVRLNRQYRRCQQILDMIEELDPE